MTGPSQPAAVNTAGQICKMFRSTRDGGQRPDARRARTAELQRGSPRGPGAGAGAANASHGDDGSLDRYRYRSGHWPEQGKALHRLRWRQRR